MPGAGQVVRLPALRSRGIRAAGSVLGSKPVAHQGSPIKHELYEGKRMKYRYQKAVQEVERLNRLYAGRVQHFLMPVKQRDTEDV